MKYRLPLIFITALIAILIMAGCAAPATPPAPTQIPPTPIPPTQPPASPATIPNSEVILRMVDRINAGDIEGSLDYFADDAIVYLLGFPPTGIEVYKGVDQIRNLWQDCVDNHFEWEVNITSVSGDIQGIVNAKTKTWHDFTRQLEVAPLEYTEVFEVKNGKIVSYGSWLTKESLARFRPAFEAVMPPEPTAEPPSDPVVSEMTVTIADGSCTITSPLKLKAGEVKVNFNVEDQDNSHYLLTLFNLDEGKDILDLMVATVGLPPPWVDMLLEKELSPGQSETYTFTLEKGPVYMVCWSQPPDLAIGNAGPIAVATSEAAVQPTATPEPAVLATTIDEFAGEWDSYCSVPGEYCALEFKANGKYGLELTEIPGAVMTGQFSFENGQLKFLTDSGLCAEWPEAVYEVYIQKVDGKPVKLRLIGIGTDPCLDRRITMGGTFKSGQ
jgi:limonene-1,2-epoxide hydrolase